MWQKLILVLLYLVIFPAIYTHGEESDDNDVFVATKEWQTVRKGQKIPKGLHVRINFETGITEAKLLDENDKDNKMNAITVPQKVDSLGKIVSKKQEDKPKFKSYEQIKDDLSELNLVAKTDAEVLNKLLAEYKAEKTDGKVVKILEDLEYLAHQYDNALEFVKLNGFKEVIYTSLNSSDGQIRTNSLILMGALAQNNPKVQIHAVETGGLGILQRSMLDKIPDVKHKSVFALGSVLRRFPWAQLKFIEGGGLVSLLEALETDDLKLRLRIVTLLYDLMIEHEFVGSDEAEKKLQYDKVGLRKKLLELNYCGLVNKLFIDLMNVSRTDFDSISRCITAMSALSKNCSQSYPNNLVNVLTNFNKELSSSEDEIDIGVSETISEILTYVRLKHEL